MIREEIRPNAGRILRQLKDFQKRSVERVFERLYEDPDRVDRFLIADEVGLGKTLIARGLIARAVDHIWKRKRIDVIYICSSRDIANQNINRLNITKEEEFSLASRLTLLPLKISDLKERKFNFVAFTPNTSFNLRSSTGIMLERALIYHILKDAWGFYRAGPKNLFQVGAWRDNWHHLLDHFLDKNKIDPGLASRFVDALHNKIKVDRKAGRKDLKTRFDELCGRFKHFRMKPPTQDRTDAAEFIGELRTVLAESCLEALEPDIVILDEFQRFKTLLDGKDEMSRLAQKFFDYKNPEGEVKILMLSATPYRMYTLQHESIDDDHYEDFIRTLEFLFNDEEKLEQFKQKLAQFRRELLSLNPKNLDSLKQIRAEIEENLKKVMIRTERLAYTPDRNGMVEEKKADFCSIKITDLDSYKAYDALTREVNSYDVMELWKSSPYLLNFMDEYALKRSLKKKKDEEDLPQSVVELLKKYRDRFLKWEDINDYRPLAPDNAKLRTLIQNGLDKGSWRLLWMPPSLPYYQPFGAFGDRALKNYTKSLIFSSWQVVPKAVSMICSYEAERRQLGEQGRDNSHYSDLYQKRRPLLIFREREGEPAGMANLTLMYPCPTLAEAVDPLEIALDRRTQSGEPAHRMLFGEVKDRIRKLLYQAAGPPDYKRGRVDERWYWAALALLDRKFHRDAVEKWFDKENEQYRWGSLITQGIEPGEVSYFAQHAERFKGFFLNPDDLGKRPPDLIEVLAKIAVASPAVTALRSLNRLRKEYEGYPYDQVLFETARIASGFRTLFNLPDSIFLIRRTGQNEPYWKQVLDYAASGNLQAVMDEYVHVLKGSLGLIDHSFGEMASQIAEEVYTAVSLRTVVPEFDELQFDEGSGKPVWKKHPIRCRYALRFGEEKIEGDEGSTRSDQVRKAFNSPFRPFLLVTTSVGQEGLDFHQYCRSIYHWNLPPNPVDLEQREGRIHRYKGLVIRKNLAQHFGLKKIEENYMNRDPWDFLFDQGVFCRKDEEDDIVPYWIFDKEDGGYKIERNVPCMPLSRDIEKFKHLKETLAVYRMVFGQPRQEDLVDFLQKMVGDNAELRREVENFRIDLSPK